MDYVMFNSFFDSFADGDVIRTVLLIALPLAALQLVLMITALVSLVRKDLPWEDKILWLLLIVLVNVIGPIIYFAIGSSKLDEKVAEREDEKEGRGGGNG